MQPYIVHEYLSNTAYAWCAYSVCTMGVVHLGSDSITLHTAISGNATFVHSLLRALQGATSPPLLRLMLDSHVTLPRSAHVAV